MKFLIFAPYYNENNGGAIALHYLCHLLNKSGYQASITPAFKTNISGEINIFLDMLKNFSSKIRARTKNFITCPKLDTPIIYIPPNPLPDDIIAVYPEIINGNPLGAKKIVRWLLHRPGFHTGKICYGIGELYFDYNSFSTGFKIPGSKISKKKLFVSKYHDHLYNKEDALPLASRAGTAYCIRKGKGKLIAHNTENSILIDNLNHKEISQIFKRVKTFISYDSKTMYSLMAVACGAESVVIPDEGISKEEWEPNPARSYGIAYGFDDLANAQATAELAINQLKNLASLSEKSVLNFIEETKNFFYS